MRPRPALPVAIILCVALAACGSDDVVVSEPSATGAVSPTPSASPSETEPSPASSPSPSAEPGSEPTGPEARALLALCTVETDLARGDAERAEATFEDDVHETLHEIAHEVEEVDREVAASLLVAKAKVEAGFADPAVRAPVQRRAVAALIDVMREAMATLDLDQPACAA